MRFLAILGCTAVALVGAIVACSSSDDTAPSPTPDAGTDAPVEAAPGDAGVEASTSGDVLQHSGTRIKLQGVQTADGTFVFGRPYDSKLGTTCYPYPAEDGTLHCIPAETAFIGGYADDKCTSGLAQTTKGSCETPKYAVRSTIGVNSCDNKDAIFKLGAKTTPAKVYVKNGTDCIEGTPAPDADYYAVSDAVVASELVAFKATDVPLTPALRVAVLDGDDGSRLQRQWFVDVARGKPCELNLAGDAKTRCTPRGATRTGEGYSDTSCMSKVGDPPQCLVPYEPFDDSTAISFELGQGQGQCKLPTVRAFPLGAKRATRDEYSKDQDGGCAGPVTSPRDVFDIGSELAPATLPEVTETATAGRIVEQTYSAAGTTLSHTQQLTDTMLGVRCNYIPAADGKLRCLPDRIYQSFYSDIDCKVPLGVTSDECDLGNAKYIAQRGAGCTAGTAIFLVGTTLDKTTAVFLKGSDGMCNSVGSTSALAYYTLGAEVPAATFAEGTTVTR